MTCRSLARLVTRTRLPKGRSRWAAVRSYISNASPLAVSLPWNCLPYQEALPIWYQCFLVFLTALFEGELAGSAGRSCAVRLGIAKAIARMMVMNRRMHYLVCFGVPEPEP